MLAENILDKYEITVGIECHVQLATKTKLFSEADNNDADKQPNTVISPLDLALPGMLPTLNRSAIDLAVKAGKALNCEIAKVSSFDRKHYFYPDLPKGYQTTQMYQPIILSGTVKAPLENGQLVTVRIHHAHLEEDAGKLTHFKDYSLVDFNRAGTPLLEIVSEPDMHSAEEAKAYCQELYQLLTYAGVTKGDLYNGNMRFDVNVSVALKGATKLGTRTETKNLNSFRSVERAVEFEAKRQIELLEAGEKVVQETRGWDDARQKTTSQRNKEDAQDYRYMPDADIPPVILTPEEIREIQATVPNLPPFYRQAWEPLKLDATVVNALLLNRANAEKLQTIFEITDTEIARRVAFWIAKLASKQENLTADLQPVNVTNQQLIDLAKMVGKAELNSNASETILDLMVGQDASPREIAKQKNLLQVSDETEIIKIVDETLGLNDCQKAVLDFKAGNEKVIGFLVGRVMQASKGKANPGLVQKIIKERLKS